MKVTLVKMGLLDLLYMPPPWVLAWLPLKVTVVKLGLLPSLYMPPPLAELLPLKATLVNFGLLLLRYMPPPAVLALLPLKMRLDNVALPLYMFIPPPQSTKHHVETLLAALPAVMVNPSRIVVFSELGAITTLTALLPTISAVSVITPVGLL